MNNATRLKRLKQLKYMLDNHHKIFKTAHFDLGVWFERRAPLKTSKVCPKDACGSAACALGSAAIYPPFMKEGLQLRRDNGDTGKATPFFRGHDDVWAGSSFFGISFHEAESLFLPGGYYNYFSTDIKPKHVSARVSKLIKEYSADGAPQRKRK